MAPRTIVITGAGRGLGLGLARSFAAQSDRVIGTVRSHDVPPELTEVADRTLRLDVRSDDQIAECVDALGEVSPVDVLINNAGIDVRALRPPAEANLGRGPLELSRRELLGVFDVNVVGPLLLAKALRPLLSAAEQPIVVNISSQLGSMAVGAKAGRDAAYNTSKAALNMITAGLANAFAPDGICVVCVHPGWIRTDMGGPQASLTVEESASAVAATVNGLSLADSGLFFRWDGTVHPW